jgi:hypothetical protein
MIAGIMGAFLAGFWQACSFIAGTLIGLSIMLPVFASMNDGSASYWQTVLVFSSPIILAAGITLHMIPTATSGSPRSFFNTRGGWKSWLRASEQQRARLGHCRHLRRRMRAG